jgi:hypothetical protein
VQSEVEVQETVAVEEEAAADFVVLDVVVVVFEEELGAIGVVVEVEMQEEPERVNPVLQAVRKKARQEEARGKNVNAGTGGRKTRRRTRYAITSSLVALANRIRRRVARCGTIGGGRARNGGGGRAGGSSRRRRRLRGRASRRSGGGGSGGAGRRHARGSQ